MYRLPIHHMNTIKIKIKTTKKYLLQFQLVYICYYFMCIHEQARDAALDTQNDHLPQKTVSIIQSVYNFQQEGCYQ